MSNAMQKVADATDVVENQLLEVRLADQRLLLTRVKGRAVAVLNVCPHMGLSMGKGTVSEGVLRCPWHGSRFDFCTGKNLDWVNAFVGVPMPTWTHKMIAMGKSPAPLQTLPVEERDGAVFVGSPG